MRILFTICGRAGSKGVKNKNLREFLGAPLSWYSLSAIDLYLKNYRQDADFDVVANSDSRELLRVLSENPFLKVDTILRGEELSGDTAAKKDVILDCLRQMEERKGYLYDVVVDLDITSPLRKKEDLLHLITTHFDRKADITYSVTPARRNPYFNQVTYSEEEGARIVIGSDITTRQQAPAVYDMNASLDAYRPDFIKNGGDFDEGYEAIIEMEDTAVLDIDSEEDFRLMGVVAKYLFENDPSFGEIRNNIPTTDVC
ncbi:MAG: acylneuraminate cytidylyltransferase family protein [Lachnospiraceae bacterium]|nr:acylneuraminate cytidylyltransferase family protein [Lachnospiraceae bacterium]